MSEVARVTAADVARLTAREFPEQTDEAWAWLKRYGQGDEGPGVHRVRAAILHLAEGDLSRLAHFVKTACEDFRDVLSFAEYPNHSDGPEARLEDSRRYRRWLSD